MRAIEADNEQLKGRPCRRSTAVPGSTRRWSTGLIDLFSNIKFDGTPKDFDLIGRIYEYFISEFASNEGQARRRFSHTEAGRRADRAD